MKSGRLHWYLPEELNDEQREFYDALASGPRNQGPNAGRTFDEKGRMYGAFNARLLNPKVGNRIQESGVSIRFRMEISGRMREMTILEVASSERCNVEWNGHSSVGRREGLTDDELEAIRTGDVAPTLSPEEQLARRVVQTLIREHDLSDELFAQAEQTLGLRTIFDLISIIGHYQHTAMSIRVWQVPVRPGEPEPFGKTG